MYNPKRIWIVEDKTLSLEEVVKKIKSGQPGCNRGYRIEAGERILYLLNDSGAGKDRTYAVVCVETDSIRAAGTIIGIKIENLLVDTGEEHSLLNAILECGNPDYAGVNQPVQFRITTSRKDTTLKKPFTSTRCKPAR